MTDRLRPSTTLGRRALVAVTASIGASALAGCFASDGDEDDSTTAENEVVVGPNSKYVYDPDSITVTAGETVTWTWASNNHNVVVDEQPDDADWPGTDGGAAETYDDGYEYTYTFETPGTYSYYCSPHEGMGMVAEVVVEE